MISYQYLINHNSNVYCLGYNYEETVYINYHFVVSFYFTLTNHTYMWTNRSGMQQTMMYQEEILYYKKSID